VLELRSNNIKYLYSGFDDTNPEILDYGSVDFPFRDWTDLFLSFSEKLEDIVSRKLPPFQQLETFLIPPPEMIITAEARSPGFEEEYRDEWMRWELTQTLLTENQDYTTEFSLPIGNIADNLDQNSGLALRNRHLRRLNSLLRKNSLFLSGVFPPHILWQEMFEYLAPQESHSNLLIKENDAYLHIHYRKSKHPRIQWYRNETHDEGKSHDSFELLMDNLSIELMANNHQTGAKVFVFKDNFEHNDILRLEERLKADVKIVTRDQKLPEIIDGNVEYLLISQTHKKIGELFVSRQI